MAAVVFQLTPTQDTPVLPANANGISTSTNATQAQGIPAPLDTVTLIGQTPESQPNNNQPDPPAFVPAVQLAGAGTQGRQQTQEQQLQQLDQALQQLGVDPQSISLFNQLALLAYANDPAVLQQFVQQLQKSTQQILQQGSLGAQTANQNQQATSQAQPPTNQAPAVTGQGQPLAPPQQGTQAPAAASASAQVIDGQPNAENPAAASQNAGQPGATNSASQQNPLFLPLQELQSTVAVLGGQLPPANAANIPATAPTLNVTF